MKRREFIKAGAATATVAGAAGVGGAVGSACGGLFEGDTLDVGRIPLPNMDEYLRKVDDGLKEISEWESPFRAGESDRDLARGGELGKKAMRALYMAGMFGDLPDAGQVHPGMQERVRRALPEMGEAVAGMAEFLSNVSDEDAGELQRVLRDQGNPGMEVAQWLDEMESKLGVSRGRRRRTRAFVTQAIARLKNQSPRLLFDEYIGKVEKVAAQAGSNEEMERRLVARMGKEAFFERQQRLAMYAAAWAEAGVTAEDVPLVDLPEIEIPDMEEVDAGVGPDAGPETEPALSGEETPASIADAGPSPIVAEGAAASAAAPSFEWENRIATLSCDELDTYKKVVKSLQKHGGMSEVEAIELRRRLAVQWKRKNCAELEREAPGETLSRPERKRKLIRAGGWVLGIGVFLSALAVVLMFTADDAGFIAGAIIATPGAIMLLIGLIQLIVVGIKYRDV